MIDNLTIRELQTESARALTVFQETNTSLAAINKQVHHDSHQFYKLVIQKYIDAYGDLPSKVGPGQQVILVLPQ